MYIKNLKNHMNAVETHVSGILLGKDGQSCCGLYLTDGTRSRWESMVSRSPVDGCMINLRARRGLEM